MAFKAKKLNIDLELDFTEYIPGEAGILKTNKTDAESINEWTDMAIIEGEKLTKLNEANKKGDRTSLVEISNESKKSIIKQIDYFYNAGEEYYKKIPTSILNEVLSYINSQIHPAKKKLTR